MNSQVIKLIEEVAWAILEADPAFKKSLDEMNRICDNVKEQLTLDERQVVTDAVSVGGRHMARILLPLALELGLRPATIYDLPETNGHASLDQNRSDKSNEATSM